MTLVVRGAGHVAGLSFTADFGYEKFSENDYFVNVKNFFLLLVILKS